MFLHECRLGRVKRVKTFLCDTNIDPTIFDEIQGIGRVNALHVASFFNEVKIVKLLLDDGRVDPTVIGSLDKLGDLSPLHISSKMGYVEIVKLLLEDKRSDPNQKLEYYQFVPLIWACVNGHVEVVKILLNDPRVNINETDILSYNCLNYCCVRNNCELAILILMNPKFDKTNKVSLQRAYYSACSHGYIDIVKLLILFIDGYKFKIDGNKYEGSVVNVLETFRGSEEYYKMKFKYLKDYSAGFIFYNMVMLSDEYLKVCDN